MVFYFLLTSVINGLNHYSIDFGYCLDCVREIIMDAIYFYMYVRVCRKDSYLWYSVNRFQNYFTFDVQDEEEQPGIQTRLLRSISNDWMIAYPELEFQDVYWAWCKGCCSKGYVSRD